MALCLCAIINRGWTRYIGLFVPSNGVGYSCLGAWIRRDGGAFYRKMCGCESEFSTSL